MLTDTEENEIRPANPGQIQPASMQQFLRRRTVPQGHSESTYKRSAEASADEQTSRQSTFNKPSQVKPSVADLKISGPRNGQATHRGDPMHFVVRPRLRAVGGRPETRGR